MTFQLSPRNRPVIRKRMKILCLSLTAALLLAFIFVLPEVSIVFFFSPIIFAIAFISLNRELNRKKT